MAYQGGKGKVKRQKSQRYLPADVPSLGDGPPEANNENLLCPERPPSLSCHVAPLSLSVAVIASFNRLMATNLHTHSVGSWTSQ